jgi:hypothetical protein
MTGGARGFCNPAGGYFPRYGGYGRGGYRGRGFGRGFGRGRGPGRGFGRGAAFNPYWDAPYGAPYTDAPYGGYYRMEPADELDMLKNEAQSMKNALDEINRRMEELAKNE